MTNKVTDITVGFEQALDLPVDEQTAAYAACRQRVSRLEGALGTVLFAVTADADNNGGVVDRVAVYEVARAALQESQT